MDQHYVPRFYLKGFCDPEVPTGHTPSVWVADLQALTVKRRAPKNVAASPGYYTLPKRSGLPANLAEDALARMDSATAPIITRVRNGGLKITGQDWVDLHFFMAFLAVRVPGFRDNIEDFIGRVGEKIGRMMAAEPEYFQQAAREALPHLTRDQIEETRQDMLDGSKFKIRGTPVLSLGRRPGGSSRDDLSSFHEHALDRALCS